MKSPILDKAMTFTAQESSMLNDIEQESAQTHAQVHTRCLVHSQTQPNANINPILNHKHNHVEVNQTPPLSPSRLPRFSYNGSFTEKLLQRSKSQPSLFRNKPLYHEFMATSRHVDAKPLVRINSKKSQVNSEENSMSVSEMQFADASPSISTFSPIRRQTKTNAPLIGIEDV
jgi:hypothetical protein